ncbi:MAG: hypothetical protein EDM82_00060 [Cyanobacteria bacterium CYA]|nr:MAG: hypothetical protein EDM82_00060 [Cyanobacteria bacterium CYA]
MAEHAIRIGNASIEFRAADRLLHQHFSSAEAALDATSIAERVVLLDGVWATQMFRRPGQVSRVIEKLTERAGVVRAALRSLGPESLEARPTDIIEAARICLPITMGAVDASPAGGPYSFASKFLHWSTRCHFPIMDSRARSAINRMQRTCGIRPRVPSASGDLHWTQDYPRWVFFYSELIGNLSPRQRERLLTADLETQPEPVPCANSLLRVLDKVFYTLGGSER